MLRRSLFFASFALKKTLLSLSLEPPISAVVASFGFDRLAGFGL